MSNVKVVLALFIISCLGCATLHEEKTNEAKGKVAVCHKGKKTVYVDDSAADAHLRHGDYMGQCR